MHFTPGPGWRIDVRDPFDLFFALYVRESLGLVAEESSPRLSAPVPRWPAARGEHLDALNDEWSAWWTTLLTKRSNPSFTEPGEHAMRGGVGPGLGNTLDALVPSAHQWRAINEWQGSGEASMVPIEVVRGIESRTGRRAAPFSYSLDVLPVRGPYVLDMSEYRALISEGQCSDPAGLAAVLSPRIERLV